MEEKTNISPLAIMSYIGPLCLIPFLTKEKDEFVKFHAKQGLVLFAFEVIIWIVMRMLPFWYMWQFINIVYLVELAFSIIGIVNVVHKEKKQLPLIGHLAGKVKL